MAELRTSITDWSSSNDVTENSPLNSSNINSTSANQYAGVGNYFRDVKGVIRAESLNLGFDPSSTFKNTGSHTFVQKDGSETKSIQFIYNPSSTNFLTERKIKEGHKVFITVNSAADGTGTETYYSASILSFKNTGTYTATLNLTGISKWSPVSDSQSQAEFAMTAVDDLSSIDDIEHQGSSISFSAYSPVNNLGYVLASGSVAPRVQDQNLSSIPWNQQSGHFAVESTESSKVVVFPHSEPDASYTVSLTPYDSDGSGIPVAAWLVKALAKQKNFFVVEFDGPPVGGKVYWDWEIHRDY